MNPPPDSGADETPGEEKLGFNASWSMAVGGMVGGGIFAVLGLVMGIAGPHAWASFIIAGAIALATAHSHALLAVRYGKGGGAFTFLREIGRDVTAGALSWIMILGYVLTIAVYAATCGQYLVHPFGGGSGAARIIAAVAIAIFTGLNVMGVKEAAKVEIITVWAKLAVLAGLAIMGILAWEPGRLAPEGADPGIAAALAGAAAVFMAYQGFELLTYDYEDIDRPHVTLPLSVITAVLAVMAVYVAVSLGTAQLIGADRVIEEGAVALAVAGEAALGTTGLVLITIAAAFSTAAAINATLFATARLARRVARKGELPQPVAEAGDGEVPVTAVLFLGAAAIALVAIGDLFQLIELASLVFLGIFTLVNGLAFRRAVRHRWIPALGALGAAAATLALIVRLGRESPLPLALLVAAVILAFVIRLIMEKAKS